MNCLALTTTGPFVVDLQQDNNNDVIMTTLDRHDRNKTLHGDEEVVAVMIVKVAEDLEIAIEAVVDLEIVVVIGVVTEGVDSEEIEVAMETAIVAVVVIVLVVVEAIEVATVNAEVMATGEAIEEAIEVNKADTIMIVEREAAAVALATETEVVLVETEAIVVKGVALALTEAIVAAAEDFPTVEVTVIGVAVAAAAFGIIIAEADMVTAAEMAVVMIGIVMTGLRHVEDLQRHQRENGHDCNSSKGPHHCHSNHHQRKNQLKMTTRQQRLQRFANPNPIHLVGHNQWTLRPN
jgi:hypothetical protein